MLILQGTLRAATVLGGGTNRKTGEVIPLRPVLQIETTDERGLVEMMHHRCRLLGASVTRLEEQSKRARPGLGTWRESGLCHR